MAATYTPSQLNRLKVAELKALILEAGGHPKGLKAELIAQIMELNGSAALTPAAASTSAPAPEVWVGKKKERGKTGATNPVLLGVKNIDATSGSMNKIAGFEAKSFSPMLLGPVIEAEIFGEWAHPVSVGLQAHNLENYWQYGKVWNELGHISLRGHVTAAWEAFRAKGYAKVKGDRHPVGTRSDTVAFVDEHGRNHYRYYVPVTSSYLGRMMGYIESRKFIYAPVYAWLVRPTPAFIALKAAVDGGMPVQILDFDVLPGSHRVTVDLLRSRINDPDHPFGHGYVLAGLLAGIDPEAYCSD